MKEKSLSQLLQMNEQTNELYCSSSLRKTRITPEFDILMYVSICVSTLMHMCAYTFRIKMNLEARWWW